MPYDGVFIHYLTIEIAKKLKGKKINKIIEPNNLDIVLQFRIKDEFNQNKNEQLLISSSLDMPRIYLTDEKFFSLDIPKNFCTILRKHIERGIINDIYQIRNDRIIVFKINGFSELGDATSFQLIVELMGRNSNIILLDSNDIIIDAIRKVPPSEDGGRIILPKAKYIFPLRNNLLNPFEISPSDNIDYGFIEGCSKLLLNDCNTINDLINRINNPPFPYIFKNDKRFDFYILPINNIDICQSSFNSISEMLTTYYQKYKSIYTDKAKELKKVIKNKLNKLINKLANLDDDLNNASDNLECNHLGLLLQANLYKIKKGDNCLTVEDFTKNNTLVEIKLDPLLSPSNNLKKIFSKGKKAKTALEMVSIQKEITSQEISYLENILNQIDFANQNDLEEIKLELVQNKYLKEKKKNTFKRNKINLTKYFIDGIEIIVGKNNIQNDYITNKLANPYDWWFHVKDIPGSHVLLRSPNKEYQLSEKEIRFCANLAASFSKASKSSSVPVDYLYAKYTKKIPGIKGCEVTYTNQKTIYIDPNL